MREIGRVDDDVGAFAQSGEFATVGFDCFAQGTGCVQRVAAARLTEAADQRVVVRVQKEQPRTPRAHRRVDRGNRVAQRRSAAHVDRHRDVRHAGAFEGGERRLNRNGRNVLDAVKAQVLKGFDCLALASAGKA